MRVLSQAVRDLDIYFMMATMATVTLGVGLILGNPYVHTFDSAPWTLFSELRVGQIHPTEEEWGIFIIGLAILQVITMWQLANNNGNRTVTKLARLVWGISCALYFGIGASFFLNNWLGPGYVLVIVPGCALSARICVRVRHLVEVSSGGQGG